MINAEYAKQQADKLKDFFEEFNTHCLLNKSEKNKLKLDFEKAFSYYSTVGISQEKALELLNIKNILLPGKLKLKMDGIWRVVRTLDFIVTLFVTYQII